MDYLLHNINKQFWIEVKCLAAQKEISIKNLIITLLSKAIEENTKGGVVDG